MKWGASLDVVNTYFFVNNRFKNALSILAQFNIMCKDHIKKGYNKVAVSNINVSNVRGIDCLTINQYVADNNLDIK
tara:strand:+ start:239 stop:466 length:228 start_codon:yes stop_codon:yes gene_type:complete